MEKKDNHLKKIVHNKIALIIEIILTICIAISSIAIGLSNLSNESNQFSKELESDYNSLFQSYITTFNTISGQIIEKSKENPSFEEMDSWLKGKESDFSSQIGKDIYDGIALTYKGGYAHSWNYGDYSNYDPTSRPWYQQAEKGNGETVIVAPYVTYLDPSYIDNDEYIIMTIAKKYSDDIYFDYDIKTTEIRHILENRGVQYDSAKIILYDKDGYILSSSDDALYAHNVKTTDSAISENFSSSVLSNSGKLNKLEFKKVDGKLSLLYSQKDKNDNTMCVIYPFWDVMINNFLIAGLVATALIIFEIMMFNKNKRNILEFHHKDIRLSYVLDASYDQILYINPETLKFYGNKKAKEVVKNCDYNELYKILKKYLNDDESKKLFDDFLSPNVIKLQKGETDTLNSFKFNVFKEIDGKKKPFVFEINRMTTGVDRKTVVGILAKDITEDAEILKDALFRAENANRAKSAFLAKMSHEIRTPMNAIIGEATIASKHLDNGLKIEQCIDKIMISARHLLTLINDILDMSAIESNKIKLANVDFDIKEIVTTVTTIYYSQCKEKGITFKTIPKQITKEILVGDQLRIQQMILNLLSNSFKFTKSGGEIIFFIEEKIVSEDKLNLNIVVKDTGCGMKKEYLERIFRPFEQESALTAKEHGGSGLGLSITKSFVDMMGGKIEVQSAENVGTEISITIPCGIAKNQQKMDRNLISSMRAIIVDDDEDTLEYERGILNHIGISYDCASSGEEAINIITKARNDNRMYDICILDWKMNGISGIQLSEKIRKACGDKPIVIVASAYDITEMPDDAIQDGIDACIPKPVFQSSLFDILMSLSQGKLVSVTATTKEYDFSGKRLLLVDDNDLNREIAKELLEMVGFEIDVAVDGMDAFNKFNESENGTYNAILMDVQMPVLNGYDATAKIRNSAHPQANSITIIAMTANAFTEDIAKSIESGMNDHVSKPIDTKLLYDVLYRYIG